MAKKKKASYADSTYLKQISYYKKLAADYNADDTRKRAEVGSYYGGVASPEKRAAGSWQTTKKRTKGHWTKKKGKKVWQPVYKNVPVMKNGKKVWQKGKVTQKAKAATEGVYQKELREQRSKDTVDIADDYAARGMIHSGLYAQKRGDYEKEFGKQMTEQGRQKSKQYGDLASSRTSFNRQQELEREQAKQDAIRRRAQKAGNFLA